MGNRVGDGEETGVNEVSGRATMVWTENALIGEFFT